MKPTLNIQKDAAQAHQGRNESDDERIYVNLHQLVGLQHRARGFSFLPKQPVHSLLAGRHASRVRGRGLNFEEIRAYRAGDDIRAIDWKVTARLRSPHTRVFTEERDRPALLIVDQRIGMFFGTQRNMKSVSAAELAALAAWRVLDVGDRIGAILFNDEQIEYFEPGRSRATVMRILEALVRFNRKLSADSSLRPNPGQLNEALELASRRAAHDYVVALISDFHGLGEETKKTLYRLRQHNDLIAGFVHDPSASKLPSSKNFVVTDGELQIELPMQSRGLRRVQQTSSGRIAEVLGLQSQLQSPVLPINTSEDTVMQLKRLLGQRI